MRPGILLGLLLLSVTGPGVAEDPLAAAGPQVSIIIDDLGDRRGAGLKAIALPGPVAYAFLPHTPHAAELAALAHGHGKEVLLHLPMQSNSGLPLGPGAVTTAMDRVQLMRVVSRDLRSLPHVSGVSNHMGSMLTPRRDHMGWLMDLLKVRGNLFFVDSRTTRKSSALDAARQRSVPSTWRDVFLDHERDEFAIRKAFERLLALARRRGTALAIGHPYDETLEVLADMLPRLDALGVRLVSVQTLIDARGSALPPFGRVQNPPPGDPAEEASTIPAGEPFERRNQSSSSGGHAASTK